MCTAIERELDEDCSPKEIGPRQIQRGPRPEGTAFQKQCVYFDSRGCGEGQPILSKNHAPNSSPSSQRANTEKQSTPTPPTKSNHRQSLPDLPTVKTVRVAAL